MLRPSYSELMNQLNDDMDLDNKITSRYTIVIAAAKRARQIIDGAPYNSSGALTDKAVSIAVNEMSKGDIKILPDTEDDSFYKSGRGDFANRNIVDTELFLSDVDSGGFDDSIFDRDIDSDIEDIVLDDTQMDVLDTGVGLDDIAIDDAETLDELGDEDNDIFYEGE